VKTILFFKNFHHTLTTTRHYLQVYIKGLPCPFDIKTYTPPTTHFSTATITLFLHLLLLLLSLLLLLLHHAPLYPLLPGYTTYIQYLILAVAALIPGLIDSVLVSRPLYPDIYTFYTGISVAAETRTKFLIYTRVSVCNIYPSPSSISRHCTHHLYTYIPYTLP
jgi:hypothetical protein